MVPNKGASREHPVFMMRLGAKFVFKLTLLAGSRRGVVPLGLTGPVKMRIGFARSDEGDSLEVISLKEQGSEDPDHLLTSGAYMPVSCLLLVNKTYTQSSAKILQNEKLGPLISCVPVQRSQEIHMLNKSLTND